MLRNNVLKKISEVLKHLPLKNSWDDILDDNISRMVNPVGWQLYGSRKPGHEAYELKYHFNFTYIKSEIDETDLSDEYEYNCDGSEKEDSESVELKGSDDDSISNGDDNCKMEIKKIIKKTKYGNGNMMKRMSHFSTTPRTSVCFLRNMTSILHLKFENLFAVNMRK